jgi:hypothetical protein
VSFKAILRGGPPGIDGTTLLCPGQSQPLVRMTPRRGVLWDAESELPHAVFRATSEIDDGRTVYVFDPEASASTGLGARPPGPPLPPAEAKLRDRITDAWHAFKGRGR